MRMTTCILLFIFFTHRFPANLGAVSEKQEERIYQEGNGKKVPGNMGRQHDSRPLVDVVLKE
ncbi:hypothetical protein J6590_082224, partial [Homalodisca vitripennis]